MSTKTRAILTLIGLAPIIFALFVFGFAPGLGWQIPESWSQSRWIVASLIWVGPWFIAATAPPD